MVKIDAFDHRLLYQLDINSRQPLRRLAAQVKGTRQTVEYRTRRLEDAGVITGYHAVQSPTQTGKRLFKMHFKLRYAPRRRQQFIKFFRSPGRAYWIGETTGTWDLLVGIAYDQENELAALTREVLTLFGDLIASYETHTVVEIQMYEKRYLTRAHSQAVQYGGPRNDYALGSIEKELLSMLVRNARAPIRELAAATNSTARVVSARLAQLERDKVLLRYRIGVSLEKLGLEHYKVIIAINKCTAEDERRFMGFFSGISSVIYVLRNVGEFEIELVVPTYEEHTAVIDRVHRAFPNLIASADSLLLLTDHWIDGIH